MKGCTAYAEMRHRFNQSRDTDATCDLSDNSVVVCPADAANVIKQMAGPAA
jgi:hypothetical protein